MKKLLTFITIIVLTVTISKAQGGWVTYKADSHLSLKFPKQPETVIPGTVGTIGIDTVGCGITIVDFNKLAHIDSATLATVKESPEFAEQMRIGMQNSSKVNLEPLKLGTWQGLTSYSSTGTNTGNQKYTMLMVIYGTTIYNIFTVVPAASKNKTGDIFFNSITFTK
jgi:hypothetical protein